MGWEVFPDQSANAPVCTKLANNSLIVHGVTSDTLLCKSTYAFAFNVHVRSMILSCRSRLWLHSLLSIQFSWAVRESSECRLQVLQMSIKWQQLSLGASASTELCRFFFACSHALMTCQGPGTLRDDESLGGESSSEISRDSAVWAHWWGAGKMSSEAAVPHAGCPTGSDFFLCFFLFSFIFVHFLSFASFLWLIIAWIICATHTDVRTHDIS